jgi:hypothetical protein
MADLVVSVVRLIDGRASAGVMRRSDVEQFGRWEFIWTYFLIEANPLDATEDFSPLRIIDHVEEQTIV